MTNYFEKSKIHFVGIEIKKYKRKEVITGIPGGIQYTICFATSTMNLFDIVPTYVIVSAIVLAFIIVIGTFFIIFYCNRERNHLILMYLYLVYINNNNGGDGDKGDNMKKVTTFKEYKKQYDTDVSNLGVNIVPDKQTIKEIAKLLKK